MKSKEQLGATDLRTASAEKKRQIIKNVVKASKPHEQMSISPLFPDAGNFLPEPPYPGDEIGHFLAADAGFGPMDRVAPLIQDEFHEEFVESEHNGEYEQLIRNAVKLFRIPESTHLTVVVVDKSDEHNRHEMVRCVGEPIGGYAYDMTHDAYYIRCCDFFDLGSIPVSYKMAIPNSNWVEFVPLPDELLERCLTTPQKRALLQFRERYKDERFTVQFLQSIDC